MNRRTETLYRDTLGCSVPDCYEEHVAKSTSVLAENQEHDYTTSLRAAGWAVLVRDGDIREVLCPEHADEALVSSLLSKGLYTVGAS